jgi:hypothetical protein
MLWEQRKIKNVPAKKTPERSEAAEKLYAQAQANKNGLTLIPAGKLKGNQHVEAELVDGKPITESGMVVVREQ